jgi:hypothetical protein
MCSKVDVTDEAPLPYVRNFDALLPPEVSENKTHDIPVHFVPARADIVSGDATFRMHALHAGGTVFVHAETENGWVFDLNLTGKGQCADSVLEVAGGSCRYVRGFSGDETSVDFELTHDGVASTVVVVYNTRPD